MAGLRCARAASEPLEKLARDMFTGIHGANSGGICLRGGNLEIHGLLRIAAKHNTKPMICLAGASHTYQRMRK